VGAMRMKYVFDELSKMENLIGKLKINETQDVISVDFHEYLHLDISDDYILLNEGLTHWHPDDEEDIIQDIIDIAKGNVVYLESRGFFTRPRKYGRICDGALKILDKEKFEKKKEKFLTKKHLRIYSGNEIIKRSLK
jgi:hypothetical protein